MSDPQRPEGWFAGIANTLSAAKFALSGRRGDRARTEGEQREGTGSRDAMPAAPEGASRDPRHPSVEGEREVALRRETESQSATPAAPRRDRRDSRHYMSEGEREVGYHAEERTKRRKVAKAVRRPRSEGKSSPPVKRSRNALTLRWSGLTGGVQADQSVRTASQTQLLPRAGPLTTTTTEDPVRTSFDAGMKSLPGVPVVQHDQNPPPPPQGVGDRATEKGVGATSQEVEESVRKSSEESEDEVSGEEALADESPQRPATGYQPGPDLRESGATGGRGNPTPKDVKRVTPAPRGPGDMDGSVKTNPGRIGDDGKGGVK